MMEMFSHRGARSDSYGLAAVGVLCVLLSSSPCSAGSCPANTGPCTCESLTDSGDRLKFECSGVTADEAKTAFGEVEVDASVKWEFVATNCSWASLPDAFFGGHVVEKIDIHDCELESVSGAALGSATGSLRDIRLMSNKLSSFPFDQEMPNLDTLILYDNRFDKFPKLSYPNLRLLFLGGNSFEELPEDAFRSLPQLQDLYLGGNVLTSIPPNVFAPLKHLRILACESGYLTRLSANSLAFAEEAHVDYLILQYNDIDKIDPEALVSGRFPREKLYLNHNNISVLPQALFRQIIQSYQTAGKGSVSIAENPLSCCAHLWLFRDRRMFNWLEDLDSTTCLFNDEPVKFADVKYRKLRADCARQRRRPQRTRGSATATSGGGGGGGDNAVDGNADDGGDE